jgi:phosphate-selective porin OprO and OprP
LNYQFGAFNGTPDGGSNDFDTDEDKDFAARVFAHPFRKSKNALRGLGLGISGTYGEQDRTPRGYTTHGSQRFFSYRSGTAATAANVLGDGTQWRLSPQSYWYWKSFGILGEYAVSSQEVRQAGGGATAGAAAELRNSAWQVAVSYFLTGEENSYKPVSIRRPFELGGNGWGAFELTGRVGELDVDDDAFPVFASATSSATKAFSWGVGLNWHLNRFFKATINYENTDLKAATSAYTGIDHEHVILTRLQATF